MGFLFILIDMSSPRTCLVLGASGIVGAPLCKLLASNGCHVIGAARFGSDVKQQTKADLEAAGIETVVFDIHNDDPAALPDADVLVLEIWDRGHFGSDDETQRENWKLNYDLVGKVAARFAAKGSHIVNGSTISLYGCRVDRPSRETDLPAPDNQYGLSRLTQEKLINFLCEQHGSRSCHLRYAHANAPNCGAIRRIAQTIAAGDNLGSAPDQRMQVIGLSDFVRCTGEAAMRIGADDTLPREVHVVHPRIWRKRELAEHLHATLGRGLVHFEHESGGARSSVWADPSLMIQTFGPPQEDLDDLIARICAAV